MLFPHNLFIVVVWWQNVLTQLAWPPELFNYQPRLPCSKQPKELSKATATIQDTQRDREARGKTQSFTFKCPDLFCPHERS